MNTLKDFFFTCAEVLQHAALRLWKLARLLGGALLAGGKAARKHIVKKLTQNA